MEYHKAAIATVTATLSIPDMVAREAETLGSLRVPVQSGHRPIYPLHTSCISLRTKMRVRAQVAVLVDHLMDLPLASDLSTITSPHPNTPAHRPQIRVAEEEAMRAVEKEPH
jgi:hypothetical protein